MSMSRRLARPMLSAIFVAGGLEAVRNPESKAGAAEPVAVPLAQRIPGLPEDPVMLVRINGAVQVGAGTLLALGKFRRLSALALLGSIVPTTYAGHRFWEMEDDAAKAQHQVHFFKNVGLAGGLLLALVDTEGRPSVGWRARRAAKRAGQVVNLGRETGAAAALASGTRLAGSAQKALGEGGRKAAKASRKANKVGGKAARKANKRMAQLSAQGSAAAAKAAQQAAKKAAKSKAGKKAAKQASKQAANAGALLQTGADRAGDLWSRAADRVS